MKYERARFKFNSSKARERLKLEPLFDPYNGRMIKDGDRWDAEHVFPLYMAWELKYSASIQAARNLSETKLILKEMRSMANDPLHIIATSASSNRQRGSKYLYEWIPFNLAFLPDRNAIVSMIADKYQIKISDKQFKAMEFVNDRIQNKYKHGIMINKARAWLIDNGFRIGMLPF